MPKPMFPQWLNICSSVVQDEFREYVFCVLSHFSCIQRFATLWTVARQAPLSMAQRARLELPSLPHAPPRLPTSLLTGADRGAIPGSCFAGGAALHQPPGGRQQEENHCQQQKEV